MTLHRAVPLSELILREHFTNALGGDEVAYRAFLESTRLILQRFLTHQSRWRDELVEELTQDVLMTIHRKRKLYDCSMPIIPWIRAIAKYRLIDRIRSDAARPVLMQLEIDFENDFTGEVFDEFTDVESLLSSLDERQRKILFLAKVEELPHVEIADQFGISASCVKVIVHRALTKLRKAASLRSAKLV